MGQGKRLIRFEREGDVFEVARQAEQIHNKGLKVDDKNLGARRTAGKIQEVQTPYQSSLALAGLEGGHHRDLRAKVHRCDEARQEPLLLCVHPTPRHLAKSARRAPHPNPTAPNFARSKHLDRFPPTSLVKELVWLCKSSRVQVDTSFTLAGERITDRVPRPSSGEGAQSSPVAAR